MYVLKIDTSDATVLVQLDRPQSENGSKSSNSEFDELSVDDDMTDIKDELSDSEENDDSWMYCENCMQEDTEDCSKHGPLRHVPDNLANEYKKSTQYAKKTIPDCLTVAPSGIKHARLGVWSLVKIPAQTIFGPYKGVIVDQPKLKRYGWQLRVNGSETRFLDGSDPCRSNWMRYVNCARNFEEQNLVAYRFKGEVYYAVPWEIPACKELLVFYDVEDAEEIGIDTGRYFEELKKPLPYESFQCHTCYQRFPNPIRRDEHASTCQPAVRSFIESKIRKARRTRYTRNNTGSNSSNRSRETSAERDGQASDSSPSVKFETPENTVLDSEQPTDPVKRRLECDKCGKGFRKEARFLKHLTKCAKEDEEEETDVIIEYPRELEIDGRTSSGKKTSRGARNGRKSSSKARAISDEGAHTREQSPRCNICYMKFENATELKLHTLKHINENSFPCRVCKKEFDSLLELKNHMHKHTGEKLFPCDFCERIFKASCLLKTHMNYHTGKEPYQCHICEKKFLRTFDLKIHMRKHSKKTFCCKICGKIFDTVCQLQTHSRFLHALSKQFKCDVCEKKFTSAAGLRNHRAGQHSKEKRFHCDVCNQRFGALGQIRAHIQRKHVPNEHPCGVCGKIFLMPSYLNVHMRQHTGERPYACKMCDKKFTTAYALKCHYSFHTGEKLYPCDICEKSFQRASYLRRHKAVHASEERYSCPVCTTKFEYWSQLRVHRCVQASRT